MKNKFRLIKTGSMDACSNMALDEVLFLECCRLRSPVLRLYGWNEPAISAGYSQRLQEVRSYRTAKYDLVRRITGGGLLLHGNEITYSVVCARDDLGLSTAVAQSFKIICSFLIRFYQKLGVAPSFAVDSPGYSPKSRLDSLWCSDSSEKYDILIGGKKIGGNAQKRRGAVVFQHGSIPLRPLPAECAEDILRASVGAGLKPAPTDRCALHPAISDWPVRVGVPHLALSDGQVRACALQDFIPTLPDENTLTMALQQSFAESFGITLVESGLTDAETALFQELLHNKYRNDDGNAGSDAAKAAVAQ